mgnify:CR=1 FL=1
MEVFRIQKRCEILKKQSIGNLNLHQKLYMTRMPQEAIATSIQCRGRILALHMQIGVLLLPNISLEKTNCHWLPQNQKHLWGIVLILLQVFIQRVLQWWWHWGEGSGHSEWDLGGRHITSWVKFFSFEYGRPKVFQSERDQTSFTSKVFFTMFSWIILWVHTLT